MTDRQLTDDDRTRLRKIAAAMRGDTPRILAR
jgi:hypothetical protein